LNLFTEKEQEEIAVELGKYPHKAAAGLEILKVVQKSRGWVSDALLGEVARLVEMTEAELDGVATSYNHIFRKPVGRHIIFICDSLACWMKGYDPLLECLTGRLGITLGQTTPDQRFTLLPTSCLGVCDKAPAMIVDETLYIEIELAQIEGILDQYT
jgi:NADH-quinone oxidoreductase subunit E